MDELNPFDPDRLEREAREELADREADRQPITLVRLAARPAVGAGLLVLTELGNALSGTRVPIALSWHTALAFLVSAAGYVGVGTLGLAFLGREVMGVTVSGAVGGAAAGLIFWVTHSLPDPGHGYGTPLFSALMGGMFGAVYLGFSCYFLSRHDE
jgi:hypothetical protein